MTRWNRVLAVLTMVAIACAGALVYDMVTGSFWDGMFPLEVRVRQNGNRPITKVSYGTLAFGDSADELLAAIQRDNLSLPKVADFDGERFIADVPCGGHDSGLGRELDYGQHRLLALRLEFADEKTMYKVVDIPDGRRIRTVSVVIAE